MLDILKAVGKWLALVVVLVVVLLGGALGFMYTQVEPGDLPAYAVSFGDEQLPQTGYHWSVPIAGDWLHRTLSQEDKAADLGEVTDGRPALTLPAGTEGRLTITDEAGETVFEGTADEYASFSFGQNGVYTARLTVSPQVNEFNPTTRMEGYCLYEFTFRLNARPTLTLSHTSMVQGGVIGVRLTGVMGDVTPTLSCELAPAVFTFHEGAWISYIPVDYNQFGGDYEITATAGDQTVSATVNVYGREIRELDTYTIDGTAAIPYIGSVPGQLEDVMTICDPDIYWNGAFTQPVSGKVVRDYAVMEYTDRIDELTLSIYPELAVLNEQIVPRRSVNVTMAVTPGKKVLAPAAGRVVYAGIAGSAGRTVVIEHGCGLKSILYLLGRIDVSEGEYVAQNDVLGTTQGHITCEMRLYDIPISPWEAWRGQGALMWQG
ncbi:M23 family metallopeptidase [Candidatus Allofournierella merdavium]|uniref:M23 family metallopeptidase n=1 Tax=Candidatus Allofournierella merdavium TaxID=2838593 RepID=UPI00374EC627